MSAHPPSTPRRGTQRASHLREVSNSGSDSPYNSRPVTANSEASTIQHNPIPLKLPADRKCVLWVHDEGFSRDEVVLNLGLFPDVKAGELMAVVGLKADSNIRDFQDNAQSSNHEAENLANSMLREPTGHNLKGSQAVIGSETRQDVNIGKRYLFIARDMPTDLKSKHPNLEISVAKHIADVFCLKHRSNALLTTADPSLCSASHVELCFRDEYLARSDMWRLSVGELSNKTVFRGQKVLFIGTVKAQVTAVYVGGRRVQSAFFSTDTKPVFRSESARYVLFVQMSREMWDFDSEGSGEIMFNKVVNGFLPTLFKKWASLKAKHLVSIVLFTRVEYDTGITAELASSGHDNTYHTGVQTDGNKKPYKDFYRVVVSEMASGSWTTILYQLKREFKFFRRDISMHRIETISKLPTSFETKSKGNLGTQAEAEPSLAMHGNVLEAICLASSQFVHDYIDRDLMRTGISIVIITPCAGLFEVDYETLKMTTENLTSNGIGIDLVCLPKMPLHSVPLFRYRNPQYGVFNDTGNLRSLLSEDSTPRPSSTILGSSFSSINGSLSPNKASLSERTLRNGSIATINPPSEWLYAIPHWIDVSFWTGASEDMSLVRGSAQVGSQHFKTLGGQRTSEFAVRCKMYEMEMSSIMENGMTEISVAPLQHEVPFLQMATSSQAVHGLDDSEGPWSSVRREKPFTSLAEFVGGPSKPVIDRHTSQEYRSFFKLLDSHDSIRSEISKDHFETKLKSDGKKYFKPSSVENTKDPFPEIFKTIGTSITDESSTPKASGHMNSILNARNKSDNADPEEPRRPRKSSFASSMTANPKKSPSKPGKLGRQISLGKYGFGIAAPKATSAEIKIEHVNAAVPALKASKGTDPKKFGNARTSHVLSSTSVQGNDQPLSAQSEKLGPRQSSEKTDNDEETTASSRPMTIKSALQSLDSTNQYKSKSMLGSLYEVADRHGDSEVRHGGSEVKHVIQSMRSDDTQKLFNSKLLAGSVPELPTTLSPTTALSPWLSVLNPSNPRVDDTSSPSLYRRWQHVFPRPIMTKTMKWKSLCSPASVPLTTEYFPTKHQLETEYQQKPYNISQNFEEDLNEVPQSRDDLLRELIGLRLSHGFQIVIGPLVAEAFGQKSIKITNVFDRDQIAEEGASVFMSIGNIIHQLSCVNETEVEINMFVRKPIASTSRPSSASVVYNPAIRTTLAEGYNSRSIVLGRAKDDYNWNYVDAYIAGFDEEMSEHLRFWRARFVLIPVQRPTQSQRYQGEDNEEETRLEGIKKLTQMWQRHRIITTSERRYQTLASRKTKDPNPLDIVYKTEDPSIVVSAELETLPLVEIAEPGTRRGQLIETESFRKAKLDIAALAEAIQAPVERGGVRVQNRRWHFRLHYNCFIGSDMTTWLIENFEDIQTREEAVEFGNKLMVKDELQRIKEHDTSKDSGKEKEKEKDNGIFIHVEKRHPFRDGQYFYQVSGEFAKQRPESRSGWFASRKKDVSVPSTPMSEITSRESPRPEQSRSSSHHDERSSESGATTPTTAGGGKRPRVALSKVMRYDVDYRKRSYRPETINLHYDRLHNPDNCYHIRIDWMSVTAKLIEDAITSWASTAERYGLRLVEAPIGEACGITSVHPFRSPYMINLAVQPPDQQPRTYFDINSFGPQSSISPASRHYYQKAIMKKFNFVLDIEAARNFPSNVDVTYSWGKPDFKYTQYIHRSGVVLAQITDEGNFLLLANRLYNNRGSAREAERLMKSEHLDRNTRIGSAAYGTNYGLTSDRTTPLNSPSLRPVITTAASLPSPILRATSDVLGASFANSKIACIVTPETVKNELEAFCQNGAALEQFYKELFERATPPSATPPNLRSPYSNGLLDSNIPILGLPPNVFARDTSPSPMRLSSVPGVGSSMPQLGRRPSVQVGISAGSTEGFSGRGVTESPRSSVSEGDKA